MAKPEKMNGGGWKDRLNAALDDPNSCLTPILVQVEAKTGIKRLQIVLGEFEQVLYRSYY